jgi:hypothetical protein
MIKDFLINEYFGEPSKFRKIRYCKLILDTKLYRIHPKKGLQEKEPYYGEIFYRDSSWSEFRDDLEEYYEDSYDEDVEEMDWSFIENKKLKRLKKIMKQLRDEGIDI